MAARYLDLLDVKDPEPHTFYESKATTAAAVLSC